MKNPKPVAVYHNDKHQLEKLERKLEKGELEIEFQNILSLRIIKSTVTQPIALTVDLRVNRLCWESSIGVKGRYDFPSNLDAYNWVQKYLK